MLKPISRILHTFLFLVLIGAFGSSMYYIKMAPLETPAPIVTPIPSEPSTFKTKLETDWSSLQPGLERRLIRIYNDQNQPVESVYIWRLDQRFFRLDVAFNEAPKSLQTWQKETNAALVMNGGYFSVKNEKYFPDGLTIVNGKSFGHSFNGFGGMLAIKQSRAELRWLVQKPYNSYESLQAALQSFPMLVKPGGQLGFGEEREDYVRARRTVIGQDKEGRILFIVAAEGYFTLHQLSVFLTESDLNLDIAINLDGGGSTGILVSNPEEIIPSKTLLPFVILAYARG